MKDLNRMLSSLDRWGLPLTLLICLICCTLQTSAARKGSTVADTLSQTAPAPTGTSARSVSPTPMLPAPSQEVLGDTLARTGMADTLRVDSSLLTRKIRFLPKHSPAKATLMSAVLPGLGQLYNKKYWKIPVVYAAMGTSTYFYIKFRNEFTKYQQAYIDLMDGDESTHSFDQFEIPPGVTTERYLTVYRDNNRRYRDWWMIGLILSYSLNIIDAVVDAHFFDFNVDENLTLSVEPLLVPAPRAQHRHMGVNLKLSF
jgi:hypothetical protein